MSGRFFLDANLLLCAIDGTDPGKQAIAQKWVATAHQSGDGLVSYQVVQEWFTVVLRKAAVPLGADEAASIYRQLIEPPRFRLMVGFSNRQRGNPGRL
jgi:predicted nucleic acid-binding protein